MNELRPQQALVASLHTAVEALTTCVESIYDLIEHVDALAQVDEPNPHRRRARVSYGGGLSPLASLDHQYGATPSGRLSPDSAAAIADAAGLPGADALPRLREDPASRRSSAPSPPTTVIRPGGGGRPSASALMAATDLAHRGYNREEIAERLRERWGDEANQILLDLME